MHVATLSVSSIRARYTLPVPSAATQHLRKVAVTPDITEALDLDAVCAVGCSGGKDSDALALAVARYLDAIGHRGPRLLIHSDLGRVEWKDSLPACERLAARLGWELVVVHREAGDMLARWQSRWEGNVRRYANLECAKLILPWSTPSMRFCTSELKSAIIARYLRKRFPTETIVNVTGIRRQESASRAKMPVAKPMTSLARKGVKGFAWNAIIEWKIEDVLQEIADAGLRLHEAYETYGASRVSCAYCIMSTADDLMAATQCADNHDLYRQMVELEIESGFGFQGNRWLADIRPDLLIAETLERVAKSKANAKLRIAAEALLPKHLEYEKGWPTVMPTRDEAELIAKMRIDVATAVGLKVKFTDAQSIMERYAELIAIAATKAAAKKAKADKKGGAGAADSADDAECESEELDGCEHDGEEAQTALF